MRFFGDFHILYLCILYKFHYISDQGKNKNQYNCQIQQEMICLLMPDPSSFDVSNHIFQNEIIYHRLQNENHLIRFVSGFKIMLCHMDEHMGNSAARTLQSCDHMKHAGYANMKPNDNPCIYHTD